MTFNFWIYFTPFLVFLLLPWNRYLLVCHSLEGGGKRISRILWKGKGGWRFFFQGRRLDGKKVINFWRGFGVFRDDHCKLHGSYLTYYFWGDWKTLYHLLFFTYLFSLFHFFNFIQSFFNALFFINSLFKRKKCTGVKHKWVLKYLKSAIFLLLSKVY